ncbi:hypothetical protein RB653_002379 [Dictyostelium firmibasis]|uniref:Uncharacterized protein n=1 Tax=Dictyostelium firmibasis TaxID=79012 RepID=A0AAN7TXC0_9MYCE
MEPIHKTTDRVWYITGTSSGLGLNLVQQLVKKPNTQVVAITRNPTETQSRIDSKYLENVTIIKADVTNEESVKESIKETMAKFGKIDCVVNNAGFGIIGAGEELSNEEIRKIFDVNFFGLLNVVRHVTPILREQKSGYIFNISSVAGWLGLPEMGAYCSSKFAVSGLTACLDQELSPFGIKVILLSPSGFKSNFVDTGMSIAKNRIDSYNTSDRCKWIDDIVNNARGDPDKFSETVINLSENENPPKNVFLGTHAIQLMRMWFSAQAAEMEKNLDISISTDYEHAPKIEY